ncbi:hypothetical protein LIZ62_00300 [Fusicatenibacter saccharivorans]|uniref:hypothetical protein n=1 Tax=Fusicatenibacter saccharivorans TaxID=1150298 RepID=UPI001D093730|nr:hypothetical protein [Fusicatenibacter saccharivorans]MCB7098699.1 hypothetical protein [Fusicatenibacter saccharivorans]
MAKPMTTKDKIREWISDNLRYMLLIGAILLIVAAVLLIVHLVSPKNDGKSSGGTVTSSSTGNNVPDKKTQVKADSKADSEDSTGISSDVSDSANDSSADASSTDTASAPDAEAEPTSEPEAADDTSNTENTDNTAVSFAVDNVPEVSTVLEQYYTALGARDINGLFAVTDNLTAEEQAQIEAESDVESYGDVKAYTISGPSDGTYIAFVSSRCKYLGINQTLPMLSEYYLYTKEDGSLKIMDDTDSDAAVTEAMKAALENEEVKNLIEQVQNDYRNALDADASLRAYVESIQ